MVCGHSSRKHRNKKYNLRTNWTAKDINQANVEDVLDKNLYLVRAVIQHFEHNYRKRTAKSENVVRETIAASWGWKSLFFIH